MQPGRRAKNRKRCREGCHADPEKSRANLFGGSSNMFSNLARLCYLDNKQASGMSKRGRVSKRIRKHVPVDGEKQRTACAEKMKVNK